MKCWSSRILIFYFYFRSVWHPVSGNTTTGFHTTWSLQFRSIRAISVQSRMWIVFYAQSDLLHRFTPKINYNCSVLICSLYYFVTFFSEFAKQLINRLKNQTSIWWISIVFPLDSFYLVLCLIYRCYYKQTTSHLPLYMFDPSHNPYAVNGFICFFFIISIKKRFFFVG